MHNKTYNKSLKISIIEDSEIHREWLKTELVDHFNIVSMDSCGRAGIESIKQYQPNMVLLDFQLKDMTALEVSKRIKNYNFKTKIFILTAHNEISIVERIINDKNTDALAIKGSHYFESNFLTAIMHVVEGETYLDPSLLKKVRDSKNLSGLTKLTKREFEIFIQSNSGKSDEKIASDLCLELSHVRNVKSRIAHKIKGEKIDNLVTKLINNSHSSLSPSIC